MGAPQQVLLAGGPIYQIARTLRFDRARTTRMSLTTVAGNRQIFTIAGWVKRTAFGVSQTLFSNTDAVTDTFKILFNASEQIEVRDDGGAVAGGVLFITTKAYHDPTAPMFMLFGCDTTQATSTNRAWLEINGVRVTAFGTAVYPTLNSSLVWNKTGGSGYTTDIGRNATAIDHISAYISDVYSISGSALTSTSFGRTTSTTGNWTPTQYTGTYGAAGWNLKFSDNSNTTAATLGKDSSGNSNNFTPINFSVAAGSGNDSLTDTPTNYGGGSLGGDVRGDFCIYNAVWPSATGISNGGLDATGTAVGTFNALAINSYWEISATTAGVSGGVTTPPGTTNTTTIANGKTYGFRLTTAGALDYINITDGGAWTSITTGLTGIQNPYVTGGSTSANFGQRAFVGTMPANYASLCAQNLSSTSITASGTFTGNGAADGPVVFLNGIPTTMTINGNAVTFGTHADMLAEGIKLRTASASYNTAGSNTFVVSATGEAFKTARGNPGQS